MDPRDGAREGKVTEFKVETSYYFLASVTEFLWKRELYPKSGYLRLCSWQSRALSGSGPVRVTSGTLTCERVSEAGPGGGRSHHDVGTTHAVWVQYTAPHSVRAQLTVWPLGWSLSAVLRGDRGPAFAVPPQPVTGLSHPAGRQVPVAEGGFQWWGQQPHPLD